MVKRDQYSGGKTTIPAHRDTRDALESIKLSDGEESWDHLLNRLLKIRAAAREQGLFPELVGGV